MTKILLEGGNVWDDVTPFDHKDIPQILKAINGALAGTGIKVIPVGSGATPTPGKKSGDLDVMADEAAVLQFFNVKDAKSGRKALSQYIASKNFMTAQTGINVHVKVPVDQEAHQVDIMVVPGAAKIAKFHTHNIPTGSPYKGVNKQILMSMLAKDVRTQDYPYGMLWSAWQGLFSRGPDGKKAAFVSDDLDTIASILLGPGKTAENLGSVESMLGSLPPNVAGSYLEKARQDPNWHELKIQESTGNWFRDILNKIGA